MLDQQLAPVLNAKPNSKKMNKLLLLGKNYKNIAALAAMFFIADRFFKYLAINHQLPSFHLGNYFSLNFVPNYFISFSLPLSGTYLLVINGLIISTLIIYLIVSRKKNAYRVYSSPLILIITGAISNYLDRLSNGFVIDYLDVSFFTVFNLADITISIGTLWLIGLILVLSPKNR